MDKLSDQRLHELELGVTTLRQGEIVAMAREIFELRAQTRDLDLLHEKIKKLHGLTQRGFESPLDGCPVGDPDPVGGS